MLLVLCLTKKKSVHFQAQPQGLASIIKYAAQLVYNTNRKLSSLLNVIKVHEAINSRTFAVKFDNIRNESGVFVKIPYVIAANWMCG